MLPDENDALSLLSRHPLFKLLGEDDLQEFAGTARIATLRSGQVVYDHDDNCNGFFLIVSGKVILERETGKGEEKIAVYGLRGSFRLRNAFRFHAEAAHPGNHTF